MAGRGRASPPPPSLVPGLGGRRPSHRSVHPHRPPASGGLGRWRYEDEEVPAPSEGAGHGAVRRRQEGDVLVDGAPPPPGVLLLPPPAGIVHRTRAPATAARSTPRVFLLSDRGDRPGGSCVGLWGPPPPQHAACVRLRGTDALRRGVLLPPPPCSVVVCLFLPRALRASCVGLLTSLQQPSECLPRRRRRLDTRFPRAESSHVHTAFFASASSLGSVDLNATIESDF